MEYIKYKFDTKLKVYEVNRHRQKSLWIKTCNLTRTHTWGWKIRTSNINVDRT